MATVPPADRTSPSLDPRYDPMYQRGYTDGDVSPDRRSERRSAMPVQAPAADQDVDDDAAAAPAPADTVAVVRPARPGVGALWIVSAALIVVGLILYFSFGPIGYGADWSVSTTDGSLRFADGRTVAQVLATQLAVTVSPYLVVLGVATAVATLFLQVTRSQRGTR